MKKSAILLLFLLSTLRIGAAQVSGGAGTYGGSSRNSGSIEPALVERAKREASRVNLKEGDDSTFIEGAILMNVKADQYVAVFALFAEGETPEITSREMDATLAKFTASLDQLGVASADRTVDYISQSRVYGFDITNPEADEDKRIVVEKLRGFELKKNVSIRFRDIARLEGFVAAAARANIFDLVKVDYFVQDAEKIQAQLQLQTANIIRQKVALYGNGLGLKLNQPTQIVADIPSVYSPIDQYDSYGAVETEDIRTSYNRSRDTVVSARKSRSTYFAPLSGDGFDKVINPVILEPVVQFTTYIKVKFAAPKKK